MLPILALKVGELCHRGTTMMGASVLLGHTHVFRWEVLTSQAERHGHNVDQLLSAAVLRRVDRRPPRAPFVIFWEPRQGGLHLTVSGRGGRLTGGWFASVPGHAECSRQSVSSRAVPWLVWDDGALTRVYRVLSEVDPQARYVDDLGSYAGLGVGVAAESLWAAMCESPGAHSDYSPVPTQPQTVVALGDASYTLNHAWLSLG